MCDNSFESAGDGIAVKELLEREEISLLAFSDEVIAVCMPGAQVHQLIFDSV